MRVIIFFTIEKTIKRIKPTFSRCITKVTWTYMPPLFRLLKNCWETKIKILIIQISSFTFQLYETIHLYPEKDVYCAVYVYSIHIHVHVHQIHESDVYLCCVFTRNTRIFRVSKNVFLVFKVIIAYFEQIILGNYKIK